MRTIDTSGLTRLGSTVDGPFMLGSDRLLRESHNRRPMESFAQAQASFDAYLAVWETGIGSPEPYEVVRTSNGWGFVVEYVRGMELITQTMLGLYTVDEAAREMALLQRRMHAEHMAAGTNWHAAFCGFARCLEPLLPRETGSRLRALVEEVPASDALLHGDFHFFNVVIHRGRPYLIDLERAGFGHPAFDLAISRACVMYGHVNVERTPFGEDELAGMRLAFWRSWLQAYFDGLDEAELDAVDRRLLVLSEVYDLCFAHEVPASLEEARADRRWRAVDDLAGLLENTLPGMDRLWF